MEAMSRKCTNNQVQPHVNSNQNKSSVFGNFELEQFRVSLSYRNSTDTEILKNKLRIEIGAMCAINKSSQLVNSKCAEIMNIGYMA